MSLESTTQNHAALDQVEAVRGQLDELTRKLKSNANCTDVMKHIQTIQVSLESISGVTLHRHLETCVSNAVRHGRGRPVIDELVDVVKCTPALSGSPQPHASAIGRRAAGNTRRDLSATTLTLPGISSRMCKAAIERVVSPIAGVGAAEVDVLAKSITIYHDYRAPARRLIEAIEEQGYHVSNASVIADGEKIGNRDSRWQRDCLSDGDSGHGDLYAVPVGPGFIDGDGI
jgi:DNA-binding FrmR family transcriptional regulator/copper chaperone CopZ